MIFASIHCSISVFPSFQDGPFEWGEEVKGVILSSYFFGYLVSQVPGGRAAEVFSAKWILFASVALNIVPTLLTPPAAMMHWSVLVLLRIIEGVGGVSNALMYVVQFVYSIIPLHINKFLHSLNVCLYFWSGTDQSFWRLSYLEIPIGFI